MLSRLTRRRFDPDRSAHDAARCCGRRCARHDANAGLGVELLSACHPRRPIAHALGIAPTLFFGMFSGALLLSAATAPMVGQLIDRHGGRAVLSASNLVLAAGLALLGWLRGWRV